jgi:hypothetical protein
MKRLFWLGVGLAVGVYVTRQVSEAAHRLTPAGVGANLADGLRELGAGLGAFGAEVRAGMAERERELAELVERRTGAPLPGFADALTEPITQPTTQPTTQPLPQLTPQPARPGARARRAGA